MISTSSNGNGDVRSERGDGGDEGSGDGGGKDGGGDEDWDRAGCEDIGAGL